MLHKVAPDLCRNNAAFAQLMAHYQECEDGPSRARSFQMMFEALTMHWATTSSLTGVEGFPAFRDRVERGLRHVVERPGSGRRVALFTSGGFIGTSVSLALAAPDRTALEVNWRVRNCSLTEFVFTKDRLTLDSFNALAHLEDAALWTYR
jgi:broad specificity phosphatase PhoE